MASLAKCGDDVWAEIAKFRRSLEAMFKEEVGGVECRGQHAPVAYPLPPLSPPPQDEGTVYLETASDLGFRSHAYLEVRGGEDSPTHGHNAPYTQLPAWPAQVIPVPREAEEDAPIYFKKALSEVDEEWAQNKKILDTTGKGLRKTIPDVRVPRSPSVDAPLLPASD